jgi:hypothetical protein
MRMFTDPFEQTNRHKANRQNPKAGSEPNLLAYDDPIAEGHGLGTLLQAAQINAHCPNVLGIAMRRTSSFGCCASLGSINADQLLANGDSPPRERLDDRQARQRRSLRSRVQKFDGYDGHGHAHSGTKQPYTLQTTYAV